MAAQNVKMTPGLSECLEHMSERSRMGAVTDIWAAALLADFEARRFDAPHAVKITTTNLRLASVAVAAFPGEEFAMAAFMPGIKGREFNPKRVAREIRDLFRARGVA